ncbi:hypothetical protein P8452_56244 [Trifolium repens]|nr:hypothetical protein P8452_56244 [Trifolium repens]
MDENSNEVSHSKTTTHKVCSKGKVSTNKRFAAIDDSETDLIECSGKYCKSCTTGLIADCVALCCCPCVVLHCFALAFIKAPWIMGRKCLGLGNKHKNKNKSGCCHKRKCIKGHQDVNVVLEGNKEMDLKIGWPTSPMDSVNVGFEAEKVWHELYQIGHLDFGRCSCYILILKFEEQSTRIRRRNNFVMAKYNETSNIMLVLNFVVPCSFSSSIFWVTGRLSNSNSSSWLITSDSKDYPMIILS